MLFTVTLARLLGPYAFGIVGQATVFVVVTSFLLDQGFSTAIVQRKVVTKQMVGTVVTINVASGLLLAGLAIAIAPLWAEFFRSPQLEGVLTVLGLGLVIKACAVAPRATVVRAMRFRRLATAEISGAVIGGSVGLITALAGGSYWALVVQTLVADTVVVVVLISARLSSLPRFTFSAMRGHMGFTYRAFVADVANALSRNVDTLLVGRFLGPVPLAHYALAYRLLLVPVQFIGEPISAVLLSSFSRRTERLAEIRSTLYVMTRSLSLGFFTLMALVACAAPLVVPLVLGEAWEPAVPVVAILALTGALQLVYSPFSPTLLALDRSVLNLRLAWITSGFAVVGIVAGLPFGIVGVATGYTVGSLMRVPLVIWSLSRVVGWSARAQLLGVAPGVVTATAIGGGYFLAASFLPVGRVGLLGSLLAAAAGGVVTIFLFFRPAAGEVVRVGRALLGRGV